MKKFAKIITVIAAIIVLLLTPSTTVAVNGFLNLKTAAEDEPYQFVAPTQSSTAFSRELFSTTGMDAWDKPTDSRLVSQQVTASNNSAFHKLYPDSTLTDAELDGHNAYVIATKTPSVSARDCYTTSAITLPANSYFEISVEYRLKDETAESAFGTFYLNKEAIALRGAGWRSATFYVKTDLLTNASITPKLYFGADDEINGNALGSIYFSDFKVYAIKQSAYDAVTDDGQTKKIDFSQKEEYVLVETVNPTEFTASSKNDGEAWNQTPITNLASKLGFSVLSKDASENNIMLLKAHNGDAALKRNEITFNCKPYEIYMFQFYSIATAASDFTGFYFNMTTEDGKTSNAQMVETLTSNSNYYNGWQLNTMFFIAGFNLNQKYKLSFTLVDPASESGSATGWACIDDFKIYKVSGDYAEANQASTGVLGTYDLTYTGSDSINNGEFTIGSASKLGTTYPYPLAAKEWTATENTDGIQNGIVNGDDSLWHEAFGSNPKLVPGLLDNNNFYMMHNSINTTNILTSPNFSTTANQKVCLSFDAYTDLDKTEPYTVKAQVWATIDDSTSIKLGNPIYIDNSNWQNYQIYISENEFAVSRSYFIQFTFDGVGFVYLDNVCLKDSTADTVDINLANPLTVTNIWQADDKNVVPSSISDKGLYFENVNGRKTVIQNAFAYNLTLDSYYEFVIKAADAQNAYLSINGYEGNLKVDNADETEYKMYVYIDDSSITNIFKITLGTLDETQTEAITGKILLSALQVKNIEKEDYDAAKNKAANDSNILILSQAVTETTDDDTDQNNTTNSNNFFGENWWYLVPSLITAAAALLAIGTFLFRKIKFEKHITKKHTSYARDMRLKNQRNKIVAQKAAKVDNVTDESQSN